MSERAGRCVSQEEPWLPPHTVAFMDALRTYLSALDVPRGQWLTLSLNVYLEPNGDLWGADQQIVPASPPPPEAP